MPARRTRVWSRSKTAETDSVPRERRCRESSSRRATDSGESVKSPALLHLATAECPLAGGHTFANYRSVLRRRRALAITDTELRLIAALASMGLRSQPKNG